MKTKQTMRRAQKVLSWLINGQYITSNRIPNFLKFSPRGTRQGKKSTWGAWHWQVSCYLNWTTTKNVWNRYNWQIYLKYNILHCPSFNEFNLNKGIKKAKQVFSNTQLITRVPRRLRVVYNINHNNRYIHICIEKI